MSHTPTSFMLGFLLLYLSACNAPNPTPVDPTATSVTAAATPTVPALEASRYHNPEARLSLVLPEGWDAAGPTVIALGDDSYNLYTIGIDPASSDGPGASRLIVAPEDAFSIEDILEAQCSTCDPHPLESSMLNGIEVQRTILGGGGVPFEVEWVFLTHNGQLIGLSIHDPESLATLEQVLATLQVE